MDIFKLPNVGRSMAERHDIDYKNEVSRYIRDKGREGVTVTEADLGPMLADDPKLGELVRKLVVDKPNWRFEVCNFYRDFDNDCIRYRGVVIKNQNGSKLGSVGVGTRYGRKGNVSTLLVHNDRIDKERERAKGFSTKDVKAALRAINKQFYDKTTDELVHEAIVDSSNTLSDAYRSFRNKEYKVRNQIESYAVDYVLEHARESFATFVDGKGNKLSGTTMNMLADMAEAQAHMNTITEVQTLFQNDKTALVIRTQDKYILCIDKDVKLCDDSTLPDNIKPKLGMLKLVEKGQVISNTGCRVNEETFVVVLDATEE